MINVLNLNDDEINKMPQKINKSTLERRPYFSS